MAYRGEHDFSAGNSTGQHSEILKLDGGETKIDLPDSAFVRDADMTRDGMDLVLDTPHHGTITIEGYFAAEPAPDLVSPDGSTLTPALVESFAHSPAQFAQNLSMADISPVGTVQEFSGEASVTRADGTVSTVSIGTPIYEGDIIETGSDGAVNILFSDETTFAVSEDARMAIDEYAYDPGTESGVQDFSVLKGVFVFTSGLIGRDDPDDVHIETPVGSIGIRGTIIAGNVDQGEITVVEGAIVLRDFNGNEMTLANQFETAQFSRAGGGIKHMGQLSANDVNAKFASVSSVSPQLFSSINDAAVEQGKAAETQSGQKSEAAEQAGDQPAQEQQQNKGDGSVDQNGDSQVDGSVNEAAEAKPAEAEAKAAPEAKAEGEAKPVVEAKPAAEAKPIQPAAETKPVAAPEPAKAAPMEMTKPVIFGEDRSGLKTARMDIKSEIRIEAPKVVETRDTAIYETKATTTTTTSTTTNTTTTTTTIEPPQFTISVNHGSIQEHSTVTGGPVIGYVHASTALSNLTFLGTNATSFNAVRINTNTFAVHYTGTPLDYEAVKNLSVGFKAYDTFGRALNGSVNANVTNIFDVAPVFAGGVPSAYFSAVENSVWKLDLNTMFKDIEIPYGDHLTYRVSNPNGTDNIGNAMTNGLTINMANSSFDATGHINGNILQIDFQNQSENEFFYLKIEAVDAGGNVVASTDYGFNVYDMNAAAAVDISSGYDMGSNQFQFDMENGFFADNAAGITLFFDGAGNKILTLDGDDTINLSGGNNILSTAGGSDNIQVISSYNKIFTGSGNDSVSIISGATDNIVQTGEGDDTVTISGTTSTNNSIITGVGMDTVSIYGQGNSIYSGEDEDTITVHSTAAGNMIKGEGGDDHFQLHSLTNKIYGMDGDDRFKLFSVITQAMMQSASQEAVSGVKKHVIDGGMDTFSLADRTGGDTLYYEGGSSIDFTTIDDSLIKNMEGLDFDNAYNNGVTLNFTDIMNMTDGRNTLVINMDDGDQLTFVNSGETVTKVESDVAVLDSDNTTTEYFDIYKVTGSGGQEVTLVVETQGTVSGLI